MSFPIEHPHLVRHLRHDVSAVTSDRRRLGLIVLCGARFISAGHDDRQHRSPGHLRGPERAVAVLLVAAVMLRPSDSE